MRVALRLLAVMVVLVTIGVSAAYGQQEQVAFTTSFAFRLGKTVHPAGDYMVRVSDDQQLITITPAKGVANVATVQTRLAEPEPVPSEGKVVFDKVGDVYYLSEVWIPGADGFLVSSTKEKHTHVKVKAARKR